MFRVSVTFEHAHEGWTERLAVLGAAEITTEDNTAHMLFNGDQAALLANLAELARSLPSAHFEVRGADLEEIFVTLMKDRP